MLPGRDTEGWGDVVGDAAADGRAAAVAMRRADPPASYSRIARTLGVSRSTAYRWANPEALEYDRLRSRRPGTRLARRDEERLRELRTRRGARHACRRCGAVRDDGGEDCWRCRLVERHAAVARRILALTARGVDPSPEALGAEDPVLADRDLALVLRQLAAVGGVEAPGTTTDDLADRDVVQALADGRPVAIGALEPAAREAAAVAAGCLVALRELD